MFEIFLSNHKDTRIVVTDYYIYFYPVVPSPLAARLQLISQSISKFYSFVSFSLQINAVNLSIKLFCFSTLS